MLLKSKCDCVGIRPAQFGSALENKSPSTATLQSLPIAQACMTIDFANQIILEERIGSGAFGSVYRGTPPAPYDELSPI